jgi:cystathionine gamma-synthase
MDDISQKRPSIRTIAAQALGALDPATMGVVPAIHLSTTFIRDADNGYSSGYVYGRTDNKSVQMAEGVIAAMEGADEALLFGSGMAAATTVFLSLPQPSHIVASEVMYWGLRSWLRDIGKYGHQISFVDTSNLSALAAAIRPGKTRIVWIETPSNPLWTITDIEAVADMAHQAGARLCVDSTVSTPILTKPLSLGADIVMHSATKYLNGHSDVVAGCLATLSPGAFWADVKRMRETHGTTLGAFEAWLLTRGMRTLDVRVRAQSRSALMLANRLATNPSVHSVLYPGLPDHPAHEVAKRQMNDGYGGMLSFRVRGGEPAAIRVAANVTLWKRATSLGGVESLIEHRSSIEGSGSPCPSDLLRLSVGLEDIEDLSDELDRALAVAHAY